MPAPRREAPFVSLEDVAARTGVSFQTVSKVLGGSAVNVSEATRARVLECAHALGYVPNAVARGLATRSTWVSVRTHEVAADGGRFELDLPPHSFSCLEVSLG